MDIALSQIRVLVRTRDDNDHHRPVNARGKSCNSRGTTTCTVTNRNRNRNTNTSNDGRLQIYRYIPSPLKQFVRCRNVIIGTL